MGLVKFLFGSTAFFVLGFNANAQCIRTEKIYVLILAKVADDNTHAIEEDYLIINDTMYTEHIFFDDRNPFCYDQFIADTAYVSNLKDYEKKRKSFLKQLDRKDVLHKIDNLAEGKNIQYAFFTIEMTYHLCYCSYYKYFDLDVLLAEKVNHSYNGIVPIEINQKSITSLELPDSIRRFIVDHY